MFRHVGVSTPSMPVPGTVNATEPAVELEFPMSQTTRKEALPEGHNADWKREQEGKRCASRVEIPLIRQLPSISLTMTDHVRANRFLTSVAKHFPLFTNAMS